MSASVIESCPQIGPFMGVQKKVERTFENGRKFLILLYAAYNAFGLIGSERNGVSILDVDKQMVLCDEIAREGFGHHGASPAQEKEFDRVAALPWKAFQKMVNEHPRKRYDI